MKDKMRIFSICPRSPWAGGGIFRAIVSKYYARAWIVEPSPSIFVQNSNSVAIAKHLIWAETSMALVNRVIGR